MEGGRRKAGQVSFYSIADGKPVNIDKEHICCRKTKNNRHQLVGQHGHRKLYKFCSAEEAAKYDKCKKKRSSRRRSSKRRHKSHKHSHSRSKSLRKYGRKRRKTHKHGHSHKRRSKSRKGSKHKHHH